MGILANMCMGAAYASSVFAKPILLHLGLTKIGAAGALVPNMALWANAFSINLACLPIGMLLSGKIADSKSPRVVVIGGGILFGLGMFLCGFTSSITWLYIFFGVIMGIGSGAAYGAIVSTSVRWFPDMRGLASGLSVGALGFGTLVIAPVASYLMASAPAGKVPVLWAFTVLGIAFLIIISLGAIVIKNPPAGYKPQNWVPKASSRSASMNDFTWKQLFGKVEFWILYLMYISGAFSGLMIISQASPIAQTMAKLTPAVAVGIVASMGLSNALGRVFWGFISDKMGRLAALLLMFIVTSIVMFLLPGLAHAYQTLLIAALIVSACYGGYLGIFPSVCADYFGPKNLTVNYAMLFSAFSIAAVAGPKVGAQIFLSTGSYANAFIVAGVVCSLGGVLTIVSMVTKKKTV
jgi:OFA family oxalate/formate antiporter-like MFS transporter